MTKPCGRCGETRPRAAFSKCTNSRDRLQAWCKMCAKEWESREGRWRRAKQSAKLRKLDWGLSEETYVRILEAPCTYCRSPLDDEGVGLDRLDNTGGYVPGNVVPSCGICNRIRMDFFTPQEMMIIGRVLGPVIRRIMRARKRKQLH
jgi:hypothetical protein